MSQAAQDGVIKYRHILCAGDVEIPPAFEALNQARDTLYALGLIGVTAQGVGYGNVSLRGHAHQFLITGSATGGLPHLSPHHYALVEAFSVPDNTVWSRGPLPASSESMTHGAIYAADARVQCVMHVHSRLLFDALLQQGALHTPAKVPYGTPEMARAVAQLVGSQRDLPVQFVMEGHDEGVVAYGADIATTTALLVDTFCRTQTHDQDRHHRR